MHDYTTWQLISKHLANDATPGEEEVFVKWFNRSEENQVYFYKVKSAWDPEPVIHGSFRQRMVLAFRNKLTFSAIRHFIITQALGNLVGFIVGIWVVSAFSHTVLEKRSLRNIFGLAGRKQVVVNDIAPWMQEVIAILAGYIMLELINYCFQPKQYLFVWKHISRTIKTRFR